MNSEIILVTGGVKSGKSSFALRLAEEMGLIRGFVATATALDDEMRKKIAAHQAERGQGWQTFESPSALAQQIETISGSMDIILVDCLTMWISNLLTIDDLEREQIESECDTLLQALKSAPCPVILVTNEVNMGIMPADERTRLYQNLLGALNRDVASIATRVYFMIAGITQQIK